MAMILRSPAFATGDTIPDAFTCEGANAPPPLEWSGVPAGTQPLLLVCTDPDAPHGLFHHWAVYDIPADATTLAPGATGLREAVNDFGKPGYGGPSPPRGQGPHAYHFRLSALRGRIDAPHGAMRCAEVMRLAKPLEIDAAELVGHYERPGRAL